LIENVYHVAPMDIGLQNRRQMDLPLTSGHIHVIVNIYTVLTKLHTNPINTLTYKSMHFT
jgi:hypothetical protein